MNSCRPAVKYSHDQLSESKNKQNLKRTGWEPTMYANSTLPDVTDMTNALRCALELPAYAGSFAMAIFSGPMDLDLHLLISVTNNSSSSTSRGVPSPVFAGSGQARRARSI